MTDSNSSTETNSTDSDGFGTAIARDDRISTIDPEIEPEYVGAHSSLTGTKFDHWVGETRDDLEPCDNDATHTIVIWDGSKIIQMASCDDCGEPEDVDDYDRKWTGEVVQT